MQKTGEVTVLGDEYDSVDPAVFEGHENRALPPQPTPATPANSGEAMPAVPIANDAADADVSADLARGYEQMDDPLEMSHLIDMQDHGLDMSASPRTVVS